MAGTIDFKRRLSEHERDELEALMEARDPDFAGPMGAGKARDDAAHALPQRDRVGSPAGTVS